MPKKYALKPDELDPRDYIFKTKLTAQFLPDEVDLRGKTSTIVDQLYLGSCTSNAIGSGLGEYIQIVHNEPLVQLSRLHHYWNERVEEGTTQIDAGAYLRTGMKVFQTQGIAPESAWPYDPSKFAVKPPTEANELAKKHTIKEYHRVLTFTDMKAALAQGCPVVIGMRIYSSFENSTVNLTGVVPLPDTSRETMLGGHAMLVVGYRKMSDGQTYAIVRNSWGKDWGMFGHCLIPESYWNAGHVSDMWTSMDATPSGMMTYEQAIKIITDKGIFDSPDYWLNQSNENIEFLQLAFIKLATYIQNK